MMHKTHAQKTILVAKIANILSRKSVCGSAYFKAVRKGYFSLKILRFPSPLENAEECDKLCLTFHPPNLLVSPSPNIVILEVCSH